MALYWSLHMMVQHVLNIQALVLNGKWENSMILNICFNVMNWRNHSMWSYGKKKLY
jgi:hypothetical protein